MIGVRKFRENAEKHGVCKEYAARWDGCMNKKQLIDLALTSQGMDYMCDAIAKGWGVSKEVLSENFARYINGKYIHDDDEGYTSEMYCEYGGIAFARSSAVVFVNCLCEVETEKDSITRVYATGECDLRFVGEGEVILVAYGEKNDITATKDKSVKMKRIQKRKADGCE